MNIIPKSFYLQEDVVALSKAFLGKFLFTDVDGHLTGGKIVEIEAYAHINDKACHSHLQKRTKRTEIMYHEGGVAYVYKIYGIYDLFNIITNVENKADAVLIRAIEPTQGIEMMQHRRKLNKYSVRLTAGPGMLSQALGITKALYGENLTTSDKIWIEDRGITTCKEEIIESPRVGIAYAEEDALLPWRFRLKNNAWTSKAK